MSNICLEAKTKEQEILKKYLEDNASDVLTDKINNGVKIEKDGKTVINKKTLDTFMKYATEEAKKLEKNFNYWKKQTPKIAMKAKAEENKLESQGVNEQNGMLGQKIDYLA